MKSFKLLSVLICLFLSASLAWGGTPSYVLDATSSDNAGSNNGYATSCDVTVEGITWNVTGNSTLSPWRIGGKSLIGVDRAVYSKTAYANAVDSIKLEIGAASSVTINSIKLIHSTNADFSSSTTINASGTSASTTYTFKPEGGFAANSYYKFVFNVTIGGSNKFIEFKTVSIYDHPTGPSVSVTGVSLNKTSTSIVEGETETLTATIAPSNATNKAVTWSSSNESVAIVSNGKVTAVSAGSADITVTTTDGSKTATCAVTVTAFVPAAGSYDIALNNALFGISTGNNATEQSVTKKGITVVSGCKSSATTKPYYDAAHIRYYKDSYLKLTAPTGYKITKVVFSANGTWNSGPSTSVGTYSNDSKTWTGSASKVDFSFSDQNRASSIAVTYAATVKSAVTLATCENGSVGASATTNVEEGTEVTLNNTPAEGYKLTAYDVYKTGESATKVTVTNGKFTMPAYGVTVSATFELAKVFSGTSLTLSGTYPTEFWRGDAFSHEGLVATAHFNTGDETVTPTFSTPDMSTAGTKTITVTFTEGAASQTATYDITVKTIENTQATAYTTAEAKTIIDAGKDLSTKVYVKGTISQIDKFNSTYGSITYWLDDNAYEIFNGLNNNGAKFTSIDDIKVGGEVIVYGVIKKFNSTYETDQNNWLVSYTAPAVSKTTATMTLGTYKKALTAGDDDEYTVTYNGDATVGVTSSDETVAEAIIVDGNIMVSALKAGTTTITVSAAETETYTAVSKYYTLTVSAPAPAADLPFSFDGGKADIDSKVGMTQTGLSTDYSASPKLKFDGAGDNVVINYSSAAKNVTYTLKGNSMSGTYAFDVMESADGKTYTTVHSHTSIGDATSYTDKLKADSRYVKFVYTTKVNGNVALGSITISNEKANADLAFGQSSYRFLTTASDMAVVATSAKSSTGAITYALTAGDESAFLIDENTGDIVCETAGSYTVTATIAETEDFKSGTATCTVKIIAPAVPNSIIVAETEDGKVFAMTNTAGDKYITSVEIQKVGDTYLVSEENYNAILYKATTTDGKTTIVTVDNMYLQATDVKNVSFTDEEYQWTNAEGVLTAATASHGTLQYNVTSPRFTTYSSTSGKYATIVSLDKVVKAVQTTLRSELTVDAFGTLCQAKNILAADGAVFYEIEKKNAIGIDLVEAAFPLTAGKPYIYQASQSTISVVYGNENATEVVAANGLVGNLSTASGTISIPEESYVIQHNNLCKVVSPMNLPADRAYINYNEVPETSSVADPTRRRVTMGGVSTNTPTSVDALSQEEGAMKFFENGILYIIRDGKVYNAQGQLIK